MKTKIDIAKSIPYMSLDDKVKLLVADTIMQAETQGKDSLLIPYERERIIKEVRKNNQIHIAKKYDELFRLACFTAIDINNSLMGLLLSTTQLEKWLLASIISGHLHEDADEIIYDLATQGYTEEQRDDPAFQKEIDTKAQELRRKYGIENDPIFTDFTEFTPPFEPVSYFSTDLKTTDLGVNAEIRVSFMEVVGSIIKLKVNLYTLDLIEQKAEGVNILMSEHRILISNSEKAIKFITNHEGVLKKLHIFKDLDSLSIKISKPEDINFVTVLKNLSSTIELSNDDKIKAEKRVEDYLKEHL